MWVVWVTVSVMVGVSMLGQCEQVRSVRVG